MRHRSIKLTTQDYTEGSHLPVAETLKLLPAFTPPKPTTHQDAHKMPAIAVVRCHRLPFQGNMFEKRKCLTPWLPDTKKRPEWLPDA